MYCSSLVPSGRHPRSINMQVAASLVLLACVAAASAAPGYLAAPALVRTPQFDSAVIKSDRLGGNFAYSTVEAQAYAAVSPVVSHVATPVAVSYHATPLAAPLAPVAPIVPAHAPVYSYAAHAPAYGYAAHAPLVL
ncbi:larval/pupal cuticle protein H1C-like [Macrosteles quadrilineatus]|uniref:larval/pupal cuticle protein H1C-like n=1 Tax=Macrosteles quadrilineatus TaxID=74068 RepID=UPI0023E2BED3|nr:larval/pupal cuticle protein H1C-like [Macrosteles quadrilineatus]